MYTPPPSPSAVSRSRKRDKINNSSEGNKSINNRQRKIKSQSFRKKRAEETLVAGGAQAKEGSGSLYKRSTSGVISKKDNWKKNKKTIRIGLSDVHDTSLRFLNYNSSSQQGKNEKKKGGFLRRIHRPKRHKEQKEGKDKAFDLELEEKVVKIQPNIGTLYNEKISLSAKEFSVPNPLKETDIQTRQRSSSSPESSPKEQSVPGLNHVPLIKNKKFLSRDNFTVTKDKFDKFRRRRVFKPAKKPEHELEALPKLLQGGYFSSAVEIVGYYTQVKRDLNIETLKPYLRLEKEVEKLISLLEDYSRDILDRERISEILLSKPNDSSIEPLTDLERNTLVSNLLFTYTQENLLPSIKNLAGFAVFRFFLNQPNTTSSKFAYNVINKQLVFKGYFKWAIACWEILANRAQSQEVKEECLAHKENLEQKIKIITSLLMDQEKLQKSEIHSILLKHEDAFQKDAFRPILNGLFYILISKSTKVKETFLYEVSCREAAFFFLYFILFKGLDPLILACSNETAGFFYRAKLQFKFLDIASRYGFAKELEKLIDKDAFNKTPFSKHENFSDINQDVLSFEDHCSSIKEDVSSLIKLIAKRTKGNEEYSFYNEELKKIFFSSGSPELDERQKSVLKLSLEKIFTTNEKDLQNFALKTRAAQYLHFLYFANFPSHKHVLSRLQNMNSSKVDFLVQILKFLGYQYEFDYEVTTPVVGLNYKS